MTPTCSRSTTWVLPLVFTGASYVDNLWLTARSRVNMWHPGAFIFVLLGNSFLWSLWHLFIRTLDYFPWVTRAFISLVTGAFYNYHTKAFLFWLTDVFFSLVIGAFNFKTLGVFFLGHSGINLLQTEAFCSWMTREFISLVTWVVYF